MDGTGKRKGEGNKRDFLPLIHLFTHVINYFGILNNTVLIVLARESGEE